MWWVDLLRGFLALCGAAVALFVFIETFKASREMRRERGPLRAADRRLLIGVLVMIAFFVTLGIVAFQLGEHWRGQRTGAGLAIAVFMLAVVTYYVWAVVMTRRETRSQSEQSKSHPA